MTTSLFNVFLSGGNSQPSVDLSGSRIVNNNFLKIQPIPAKRKLSMESQPFPVRKTTSPPGKALIPSIKNLPQTNSTSQYFTQPVAKFPTPAKEMKQFCEKDPPPTSRSFVSAGELKKGILPTKMYASQSFRTSLFDVDDIDARQNMHSQYDADSFAYGYLENVPENNSYQAFDYEEYQEYPEDDDVQPVSISSCKIPGINAHDNSCIVKSSADAKIPDKFKSVFPYPAFNKMQLTVMKELLTSDKHCVICAPTGSGKTVMLEFAMIRILENPRVNEKPSILYLSPLKSLCAERVADWKEKFSKLGFVVNELTGDSDTIDSAESEILSSSDLICSTPEKWDWVTRRWRSFTCRIRLILVDEVHCIGAENRGPTLEAVITRMKMLKSSMPARFIAISATAPNIADIGQWLRGKNDGNVGDKFREDSVCVYQFDETYRPVPLEKVVIGYSSNEKHNAFSFDSMLNYKLPTVIETYSARKPTLVFCMSRKSAESSASFVAQNMKRNINHPETFVEATRQLSDQKLRQLVLQGTGYHHAGLAQSDRQLIERFFISGQLPVLFSTSTLAVGVNLPAHLVVVKSTWHCTGPMGCTEELSDADLLQMIGRAGRPQFDTQGRAVVMTRQATKHRYESLLAGVQLLESYLHRRLVEHFNAELVLGTISAVSTALDWIKQTFLYIRLSKNPSFYQFEEERLLQKKVSVDDFLNSLILSALDELDNIGLVVIIRNTPDAYPKLKSTAFGRLMARHCIALNTMKLIMTVNSSEDDSLLSLVELIANCAELDDIALRWNERGALNALNKKCKFPVKGGVKAKSAKISVLLQATLGCLQIEHAALVQDAHRVFRVASRIASCLLEALWIRADASQTSFGLLQSACFFAKVIRAQLWEDSQHVAKQLPGVGATLSGLLVRDGIVSFEKILEAHPSRIEAVCGRHVPFGVNLRNAVLGVPRYQVGMMQLDPMSDTTAQVSVTIQMANASEICKKSLMGLQHKVVVLIGDSRNGLLGHYRLTDKEILDVSDCWEAKVVVSQQFSPAEQQDQKGILSRPGVKVFVRLISLELVGCDVTAEFEPKFQARNKAVRFAASTATPMTTVQRISRPPPKQEATDFSSNNFEPDTVGDFPSMNTSAFPAVALSERDHFDKLKMFSARLSKPPQPPAADSEPVYGDDFVPEPIPVVDRPSEVSSFGCSSVDFSKRPAKTAKRQTKIDSYLVPRHSPEVECLSEESNGSSGSTSGSLTNGSNNGLSTLRNCDGLPKFSSSVQILGRTTNQNSQKASSPYFAPPQPRSEQKLSTPIKFSNKNDTVTTPMKMDELKARFGFKKRTLATQPPNVLETPRNELPSGSVTPVTRPQATSNNIKNLCFEHGAFQSNGTSPAHVVRKPKELPKTVDLFEAVFNSSMF